MLEVSRRFYDFYGHIWVLCETVLLLYKFHHLWLSMAMTGTNLSRLNWEMGFRRSYFELSLSLSRSFLVACLQWIIVFLQALIFLLALLVRAANRPLEYDSDDELIAPRQQNRQPLLNRPPAPATGVPVAGTLDQRPSRNDAWSTRMREKVWLFLNFNAVKVWRTIWQFCIFLWPCSHLSHTVLGIHLMWYSFTKLFIINGFSLSLWKFRFLTFV